MACLTAACALTSEISCLLLCNMTYYTAGSGTLLQSISYLHDQGFELDVTTPLTFNPKLQEQLF